MFVPVAAVYFVHQFSSIGLKWSKIRRYPPLLTSSRVEAFDAKSRSWDARVSRLRSTHKDIDSIQWSLSWEVGDCLSAFCDKLSSVWGMSAEKPILKANWFMYKYNTTLNRCRLCLLNSWAVVDSEMLSLSPSSSYSPSSWPTLAADWMRDLWELY